MCVRLYVFLSACCLALAAGGGQEIESEVGEKKPKPKTPFVGWGVSFATYIFTIFSFDFFSVIDTFVCACVRTPVTDPHTLIYVVSYLSRCVDQFSELKNKNVQLCTS